MNIEFDPVKNRINIQKHGVSLADVEGVLMDSMAITIEDGDHEELRFVTLGLDHLLRILVVVWADCGNDCYRLISARKAEPHEIRQYQE